MNREKNIHAAIRIGHTLWNTNAKIILLCAKIAKRNTRSVLSTEGLLHIMLLRNHESLIMIQDLQQSFTLPVPKNKMNNDLVNNVEKA